VMMQGTDATMHESADYAPGSACFYGYWLAGFLVPEKER